MTYLSKMGKKGQSAVEFAVIIPTLFIFFYAVLEFSLLFVNDQRVSALSREISNAAFRDCGGLASDKIAACTADIVDEVSGRADGILRDFSGQGRVIVSVFGPDPQSQSNPPAVKMLARESAGGGGFSTSYSSGGIDASLIANQGVVVVGEAFYPYEPLTPLKQLLDAVLPTELYEATIY